MSKKLIKIAKHISELAEEAEEVVKLKETASENQKKYYQDQIKVILLDAKKVVTDYSQELNETSKKEKKKKIKAEVKKEEIKKFVKKQKDKKDKKEEFKVYQTNFYSKLSNFFMEDFTFRIVKKHPEFYNKLSNEITLANLRILSKTYLSILLFSTILAFPLITAISFIFTFNILISLGLGIIGMLITFASIYNYPTAEKQNRSKKIKQELVYAYYHMTAIASSGTSPLKIFELLVKSKEYKFLQPEFERVLNYINVFGYNLTNALREVASKNSSPDLSEFFYGMASTLETGGGITQYLESKAEDELHNSRLEQEKYLETVATYSEIYIGVLIAAPLLFIVTLAILERISEDIAGISINTIAMALVFGALPILNILFMLLFEGSKSGR